MKLEPSLGFGPWEEPWNHLAASKYVCVLYTSLKFFVYFTPAIKITCPN